MLEIWDVLQEEKKPKNLENPENLENLENLENRLLFKKILFSLFIL